MVSMPKVQNPNKHKTTSDCHPKTPTPNQPENLVTLSLPIHNTEEDMHGACTEIPGVKRYAFRNVEVSFNGLLILIDMLPKRPHHTWTKPLRMNVQLSSF